ncbi:MAG: FAD-dependent oxidoreductase [Desulfobacterales bacterium]|nr:FAD-dependent oxidoreductase [Desulfobacterales bacterium]
MVMGEFVQETDLLVIGSGPGGYAAAFRAADLGLEVTIVDTAERPGGACLFRGCIPSKTLLYLTELLHDARRAAPIEDPPSRATMISAGGPGWNCQVMSKLAGGCVLSQQRTSTHQGHASVSAPCAASHLTSWLLYGLPYAVTCLTYLHDGSPPLAWQPHTSWCSSCLVPAYGRCMCVCAGACTLRSLLLRPCLA